MRVLGLSSSPRRDGNSSLLVQAALQGAERAGHEVELVHVADHVRFFLRDCRACRGADGRCTIDDGFEELFLGSYLPADGVVLGTPLYWYGMSGQLKTFLDRMFCHYAEAAPAHDQVLTAMTGKRLGLVVSSEETYAGATLGLVHQVQELARYTHSPLVGVVRGIGNTRGEVTLDPEHPIRLAFELGRTLLERGVTDYRLDTVRPCAVWSS